MWSTESTSLALRLTEAGFKKTPLARAVGEIVASLFGSQELDSKILAALQSVKSEAQEVLTAVEMPSPKLPPLTDVPASNNTSNPDVIKKAA